MKKANGFTLIELVMVIVILGVLAAVALPRFVDLRRDAKVAAIEATAGAVRSASALGRAKCVVTDGCNRDAGVSLTSSGRNMDFWLGYLEAGFANANGVHAQVQASGMSVSFPSIMATQWRLDTATDLSTCYVQYIESQSFGQEPQITVVTTGC